MHHQKIKGFVIRSVALGEADRLVSLLTSDHGLIKAYAKGARRQKSALRLGTQDFVLGQFELFNYKDRFQIDAADLIEPFLELQQDMDRLVCAAHLMEVLHDAAEFGETQPDLYQLCGYTMQALRQQDDPILVVHVAQMRVMRVIGLAPHLDSCMICGKAALQTPFFSVNHCGLICGQSGCRSQAVDAMHLPSGLLACIRHSLNSPMNRLFQFKLDADIRQRFITLAQAYLIHQMEKPYPRLDMLSALQL